MRLKHRNEKMNNIKNWNLEYFIERKLSFVLIKDDKTVYKSRSQGLKPLVFCLKKYKKEMKGAIVFDKVIGLAATILLASTKVKEIQTLIISQKAKKYLTKSKIKIIYKKEVKNIMNKRKNDLCGMEKLAAEKGLRGLREFWEV